MLTKVLLSCVTGLVICFGLTGCGTGSSDSAAEHKPAKAELGEGSNNPEEMFKEDEEESTEKKPEKSAEH